MPADRTPVPVTRTALRTALCLAGAAGIAGTASQDIGEPGPVEFWVYFTVQSNLLLTGYFAVLLVRSLRRPDADPAFLPAVKGAVTLYILITGTVFNLLLANPASPFYTVQRESHYTWDSVLMHVVTPLAALLDWLLFGPRGALRWRHALVWLAYPLAYLAFALVRGAVVTTGMRYPYPFVDVAKAGYAMVSVNCTVLAVAFYLLGTGLVAADRALTRRGSGAVAAASVPGPAGEPAEPETAPVPGAPL
ncbi:Pr6Pr family membrane protein [Streptacidiphilus sp. ASG 303]|uniref:Pr6Pr family membrane protein n=1 Tax=Streptacidiphilus sp. ASG 303 TaxID=2896847 RepID=UPI001E36280E|nr:Pr6Pr family membrane protein [Streptacidiphilus sp. ASG 303]MCD0485920.1 Pr6Pr family membrane protein [Streptacidiphilus sp. ASG 303]